MLSLMIACAAGASGKTIKTQADQDWKSIMQSELAHADKSIEENPSAPELYLERGDVYSHHNENDKAIIDYDKCIQLNPKSAKAYYHRANAYEQIAVRQSFQSGDNSTPLQLNNNAVIAGMKKEWQQAIEMHRSACVRAPENKQFQANLATAHLHYGNQLCAKLRFVKGAEQYALALEVDPDCKAARDNLLKLKREHGTEPPSVPKGYPFDSATKEQIIKEPESITRNRQNALKDYTKAIELVPNGANVLISRARLKKMLGDETGAISDWTEAINLRPQDVDSILNRGKSHLALNHYAEARSDFSEVLRQNRKPNPSNFWNSDPHSKKLDAYLGRSQASIATKDWTGALADLNEVIALDGPIKYLLEMRAAVYDQLGRNKDAEIDRKKASTLGPDPTLRGATNGFSDDLGIP